MSTRALTVYQADSSAFPTPTLAAPGAAKLIGDEIARLLKKHTNLGPTAAGRVADEVLESLECGCHTRSACMQCGSFDVAPYEDYGRDEETGPWSDQGWSCRACGCRDTDCARVLVLDAWTPPAFPALAAQEVH
jgi:hypothetical protein